MAIELSKKDDVLERMMANLNRQPAATNFGKAEEAIRTTEKLYGSAEKAFEPILGLANKKGGLKKVGLEGENADEAKMLQQAAIFGVLPPPKTLNEANDYLRKMEEGLEKRRDYIEGSVSDKLDIAMEELKSSKKKEMGLGEIFARSLVAIAPALVGQALIGSMGGAAGGAASVKALEEIDKLKEKEQEEAIETAKTGLLLARERGKEKLAEIGDLQKELGKTRMDLALLPTKAAIQERLAGLRGYDSQKQNGELIKLLLEYADLQRAKAGTAAGMLSESQKAERERGEADLGFGFQMKGEKWTPQMRAKAADRIGAMGAFHAAVDDLNAAISKAGIKGTTTWTESGRSVQQAMSRFMEASRKYNASGAAFSESEMRDAKASGFDPLGDYKDALRLSFDPQVAQRFLNSLKRSTRKSIAAEVTPQSVEDVSPEAKRGSVFEKMSKEQKLKYKNATPKERTEMLKALGG